jgi:hypothetical protein
VTRIEITDSASPDPLAVLAVDQTVNGSRWVPLGAWTFPSGFAWVRFVVPAGGRYVSVDGLRALPAPMAEEPPDDPPTNDQVDPPPPDPGLVITAPREHLLATWQPVTTSETGAPCVVTGYEVCATPATAVLEGTKDPAPDGSRFKLVSPDVCTDLDVTDLIVSPVRFDWRVWVRARAGDQYSAWSNAIPVTYDPGMPLPIVPAAPKGLTLKIEITVG